MTNGEIFGNFYKQLSHHRATARRSQKILDQTAITASDKGFTLIEIMIVVAIIAILAAIAMPQLSAYRTRSYNTTAVSDLKNAAIAQEAYYVENRRYTNSISNLTVTPYNLFISHGVSVGVASANNEAYVMTAYHSTGNTTYTLSGPGGIISP